jgi:hypothetical protein
LLERKRREQDESRKKQEELERILAENRRKVWEKGDIGRQNAQPMLDLTSD